MFPTHGEGGGYVRAESGDQTPNPLGILLAFLIGAGISGLSIYLMNAGTNR